MADTSNYSHCFGHFFSHIRAMSALVLQTLSALPARDPEEEETLTKQQVSHRKDKELDLLVLASDHHSQPPNLESGIVPPDLTVPFPARLKI